MTAVGEVVGLFISPVVMVCGSCHMTFAVPAEFYRRCREDGASFRCPNPSCAWDSQSYRESEKQKLERQLAEERRRRESAVKARQWAEQTAERAKRQRAAARGQVTKIRNRVAAGLCPCCRERFADLAEHMAAEHPEIAGGGE